MAKIRILQTEFWQDDFTLSLTPEEKFFYSYLLTNTKSNQVGCYSCPIKVMELETGYNRETVIKLIKKFIDYGKIMYNSESSEIYIINWGKYNWNKSPNIFKCIMKEFEQIKTNEYKELIYHDLKNMVYPIETAYKPLTSTLDTPCKKEKEKEEEKEEEKEKEKKQEEKSSGCDLSKDDLIDDELKELINIFQTNGFGMISEYSATVLNDYKNMYSFAWVKEALEIAMKNGVRNLSYVGGILKRKQTGDKPRNSYRKKETYYRPKQDDELSEASKILNNKVLNSFINKMKKEGVTNGETKQV